MLAIHRALRKSPFSAVEERGKHTSINKNKNAPILTVQLARAKAVTSNKTRLIARLFRN